MINNYSVVRRLMHDGVMYLPGDKVELTSEQAAPLLADGVVRQA